jgi:RimJ/RimL family protein N-acetyltransferase
MFNLYRQKNDKYASLSIIVETGYGWKTTIGTAHIIQQKLSEAKGLLGKFYVTKIYRRSGFEEKCLIEILNFAFEAMGLNKVVVFVNE